MKYPSELETEVRTDWEAEQSTCHVCQRRHGVETHHICLRSAGGNRWEQRCNWLWACRPCHRWLHDTGSNRHAVLLALKQLADPEGYDLDQWIWIANRGEQYVTQYEVNAALEMRELVLAR